MEATLLIATYGVARLLDKCLASIKEDIEILVGDNSPEPDGIKEVCKKYNVKCFCDNKWKGICEVYNFLIKKATRDYILFVDGDCEFETDDPFEKLIRFHKEHGGCVQPKVLQGETPNRSKRTLKFTPEHVTGKFFVHKETMLKEGIEHDTTYIGIGYVSDNDFAKQWKHKGYGLFNCDEAVLVHQVGHTHKFIQWDLPVICQKNRAYYAKKWGGKK